MARDAKIVVRLAESVRDDFEKLADAHGLSMSALAAYLIGQHVHQQKQFLGPLFDAVKGEVSRLIQEQLPSEAALDTERDKP